MAGIFAVLVYTRGTLSECSAQGRNSTISVGVTEPAVDTEYDSWPTN